MKISDKAYSRECISRQTKINETLTDPMEMHIVAERLIRVFKKLNGQPAFCLVTNFAEGRYTLDYFVTDKFFDGLKTEVSDMVSRAKHPEMARAKAFEYIMKSSLIFNYGLSNIYSVGVITALWANEETKPMMHNLKKAVLAVYGF